MDKTIYLNNNSTEQQNVNYKKNTLYLTIKTKLIISLVVSFGWLLLSLKISKPWIQDLAELTSPFWAITIVSGVALIPGFINAFLVLSLLLDKQPKLKVSNPDDSITILVSAFNEESSIFNTLKYIKKQEYKGKITTIVIDNNSTDNTSSEVRRAIDELDMDIMLLHEPKPGKFNALNYGLNFVKTKYTITLDADTLIHKHAIRYLVARINSSPKEVVAVAGSMLVRNSRDNLLAKMQE